MKNLRTSLILLCLSVSLFSCRETGKPKEVRSEKEKSKITERKIQPAEVLTRALDSLVRDTSLRNAGVGILFVDLTNRSSRSVYAHNPDLSLVPASVIKLFTTAAALEIFGGNKTFNTALQYDGTINDRILYGNLFIRGGGDPTFSAEKTYPGWIKAVKEIGIDTIQGNIFGDGSIFERFPVPLTWAWGELNSAYGAAASGLSVFGNVYEIRVKPPAKNPLSAVSGDITPAIDELNVENQTSEADITEEEIYLTGDPYGYKKFLMGRIPKGKKEILVVGSIPDPPLAAASEFYRRLSAEDIVITGKAMNFASREDTFGGKKTVEKRTNIAFRFSPSVSTIVSITNQESNNLFAEHLIKHIGLNKYHNGSEESGALALTSFWKTKGMDTGGLYIYDGCGISRYNAVTARQLVFILDHMKRSPYFATFYNSLPLAGVTGTLRNMFRGTPVESNMRAKTGTMSRVKSLAGYIRTKTGKTIGFAIILNNFSSSREIVKETIEKLFPLVMEL